MPVNTPEKEFADVKKLHRLLTTELEALHEEILEFERTQGHLHMAPPARQRYRILRSEYLVEEIQALAKILAQKQEHMDWLERLAKAETERAPR